MPENPPPSGSAPFASENPYQSPSAYGNPGEVMAVAVTEHLEEHLRRVAIYQKGLLLAVGFYLAGRAFQLFLAFSNWSPPIALLLGFNIASLLIAICGIVAVGLLGARLVGTFAGVCLALAMIIPCANLIIIFVLNQKANTLLTSHDIHVGLFGARMRDFQDRYVDKSS
jgi:hypothetical protein